jgi:hypothetical protein
VNENAGCNRRHGVELCSLVIYAHDWDKRAAADQWTLIVVAQTA